MFRFLKITLIVSLLGSIAILSFTLSGLTGAVIFLIGYIALNYLGLLVAADKQITNYLTEISIFGLLLYFISTMYLPIFFGSIYLNNDYSILLISKLLGLAVFIIFFFILGPKLRISKEGEVWIAILTLVLTYWLMSFLFVDGEIYFKISFFLTIPVDIVFLYPYLVFGNKAPMAGAGYDPKTEIINRLKGVRTEFLDFNPTRVMKVGKTYRLNAVVGETKEIIENLKIESEKALRDFLEPVYIAQKTSVSLKGEGFKIYNLYDSSLMLTLPGLVHMWEWNVVPLKKGELQLRLHFLLEIDYKGKIETLEIPYKSRTVKVKENIIYRVQMFFSIHWKWLISLIFGSGILFSIIKNIDFFIKLF